MKSSKKGETKIIKTPVRKAVNSTKKSSLTSDGLLEAFLTQSLDGFFFMEMTKPLDWEKSTNKDQALHQFYYDQKVTRVNQAFLDQYEAKESEIIGLSPADFFIHNPEQGLEISKQILELGHTTIVTDERKINGSQIWIEGNYFLFKNDKNQITGLFGIQRDISEKLRIEQELVSKEAYYRSLFHDNPHHMFIYNIETLRFISVNESAQRFYGYTQEEFRTMTIKDISPREEWDRIDRVVKKALADDQPTYTKDWRHIKKDGSLIYVDIRAQSIIYKGIKARIGVTTDVTESRHFQDILKSSEESFKGLFNSVQNAIYIQDKLGRFIDVNQGAETMYGYNRSEFIGNTPEFLSAPGLNDLQQIGKYLEATFSGKGPSSFEFWGLRKNGEIFPKHVTVSKGTYFGQEVLIAVSADMTEQKSVEQSLAVSENNFKTLFKNIYDAVILYDIGGNIIEANERALELYETSYHQITHSNIKDLSADTADQRTRLEDIWKSVSRGSNLVLDWKAKRPISGTQFDVEISLRKSVWTNKEVIISIVRDVTERKKVELDLREREESYRELFNTISDAIYIIDENGYFVNINNGAEKMYGYTREELVKKTPAYLSPKGMNDLIRVNEYLTETFKTGKINQFDFYGLRKNGEIFLKSVIINRGRYNGKDVIIAIGRDISDRKKAEEKLKESEERFRNIYENAPIGIFRTTPEGKILIANPALIKMLGYSSFEELSSLDIGNQVYAAGYSRKEFVKDLESNGKLIGIEFSMKRKDESIIYIRENAHVVRNAKGNVLYYEGTIEDITESKLAEQKLISSEQQLRETNLMKDKFLSIIAHDLRSPFQGLLGITSILIDEDDLSVEERILYEKKLHDGLKMQFALLDDLLAWSRLQRGVMEYKPEDNSPKDDIEEILVPFKTAIEKKNIILSFVCDKSIYAYYDRNMFSTIVRNLVSNAIKFTPDGGSIFIRVLTTEKDLILSVNDSGIGIEKEDLSKLFRIDSHFVRRGTRDEGGSGLGLVLCKEFVEKHNGKFWVESTVNIGSTFSFSIPQKIEKN